MPRFPTFLRSMLRLCAREPGRYRLDGVRVISADGVTTYEATDGRRIARASLKTPDSEPCDVVLPAFDLARMLGQPLSPDTYDTIDEFGNEVPLFDPDGDALRGHLDFTVPAEPGGASTLSQVVATNGGVKGGPPWPDSTGPGIWPRGNPVASICVNAEFLREMIRAAEDASDHPNHPAAVWVSIFAVTLPADATHKKERTGQLRLAVQPRVPREQGGSFASVLMPVDAGEPRPSMPYDKEAP